MNTPKEIAKSALLLACRQRTGQVKEARKELTARLTQCTQWEAKAIRREFEASIRADFALIKFGEFCAAIPVTRLAAWLRQLRGEIIGLSVTRHGVEPALSIACGESRLVLRGWQTVPNCRLPNDKLDLGEPICIGNTP